MSYAFKLKNHQISSFSWYSISLSLFLALSAPANALPGQSTDTVTSWINANPTLRPGIGDGLIVQKVNTPAQRFSFRASILPPGRITVPVDRATVRSERLTFYDAINGVTLERLKESLRVIYGLELYQDFERARIVYVYPSPATVDLSRRQNLPLLAAQQGQLLLGERFAYWLEVTKNDKDKAFNGEITVFKKEDLDKVQTELRSREGGR